MRKFFALFLMLALALQLSAQDFTTFNPITKDLQHELQQATDNDLIRINIRMKDQYDVQNFLNIRHNYTPAEMRVYVVSELKNFTAMTQQGIIDELNYYARSGEVNNIRSLWIANVLNCYATPAVIQQLATRTDLDRIDIDEERILINPIYGENDETKEGSKEITYNVLKVNAPAVWALGFTGQDAVVAVLDTGVRYTHNDLAGNMWTHPNYPFHGWNFINNTNNPMDDHGHGTHCAGTVAGNGASGSQTGVAPGAKIMALKILNNQGSGTEAGVWAAMQFAVENGANIFSMSIGWLHAWNPDRTSWRNAMNNTLAAGVVASVAAGNEGDQQGSYPIPDNIRTPGDCPPPWLHPNQSLVGGISAVISIGATDSNDGMASFSGRGPVTWQNISPFNDYQYNPGIGLIRPDVVAPGVNVKSLSSSSNTGYTTMSGTSMATPGAAGVMALMYSKNNNLLPEDYSEILENTAVKFQPLKNNTSGSGRINALAAIEATSYPGPVYASHTLNDPTGNNNGLINPSEMFTVTLALQNVTENTYTNVSATMSTNSPYITIIDNSQFYGSFNPGDTIEIAHAFSFQVANNIPGSHEARFWIETTNGLEIWTSYFNESAHAPNLTSGNLVVHDPTGNANGNLDPGENATLKIPTLNVGQITSDPVNVTLTTASTYITILNGAASLGPIQAGGTALAEFAVTVDPNAPIGQSVSFIYTIVSGAYTVQKTYYQKIGIIFEDFETGDFTSFPWTFAGNLPWVITNADPYEGVYSAKSGVITHSQSSQLILQYDVATNDSISFYRKVSSEANYDYLRFYINNQKVAEWAGAVPWGRVAFPVTGGVKIFKWEYMKDGSVSTGSDCAWIDYIEMPAPATCPSPVNPTASSVTASSALLSWLPGGLETTWDLIWGAAGFNPNTAGTLVPGLTAYPYQLAGLSPVTSYDFYVRAHCSDNDISAWSGPANFITLCDVFAMPYTEPFGTPAVTCWSFPQGQGNWAFGSSYTPPSSTSGAPNAFFNWSPSVTNYSFSFMSPLIDATNMSEVMVNYILFINSYSNSTVEFMKVEFKKLEDTEWTLLEGFSTTGLGSGNAEYVRANQVLAGMAGNLFQVRFRAHGPNSFNINGWGLDDIHFHGIENQGEPGDSNCDGLVNVLDVITTVNYITGLNPEPFCFDNADVTQDGNVNVLDVIATVNIVLGGTKTSGQEINSGTAHLFMNRYGIELESDGTLAGIQFELNGADVSSLNFLLNGFEFVTALNDNKLTGLIFSFDNTPIPAGKINLFSFNSDAAGIEWGKVVAGNLNAEEVKVIRHFGGDLLLQSDEFTMNAYPNPSKGQLAVEVSLPVASETNVRILDITGREVYNIYKGILSEGTHKFETSTTQKLSAGVYLLQITAASPDQGEQGITRRIKLVVTE